ncbi:hypothetical protein Tco_0155317 [Tanacetum coccineum]
MENANPFVPAPPNGLRTMITQELNELRAISAMIDSRLENINRTQIKIPPPVPIEQLLNDFMDSPDDLYERMGSMRYARELSRGWLIGSHITGIYIMVCLSIWLRFTMFHYKELTTHLVMISSSTSSIISSSSNQMMLSSVEMTRVGCVTACFRSRTDKAKTTRKRLKPGKHEHKERKSTKEAGNSKPKVLLHQTYLIGQYSQERPRWKKESTSEDGFYTQITHKINTSVSITDCHTGNPCEIASDPTAKNELPIIERLYGYDRRGRGKRPRGSKLNGRAPMDFYWLISDKPELLISSFEHFSFCLAEALFAYLCLILS